MSAGAVPPLSCIQNSIPSLVFGAVFCLSLTRSLKHDGNGCEISIDTFFGRDPRRVFCDNQHFAKVLLSQINHPKPRWCNKKLNLPTQSTSGDCVL